MQRHISERVQAVELEPTSLKREEGLISGLQGVVEDEIGGEGEGGGSGMGLEDERISTVMGLI
jgi:hypothetical protein